MIENLCIARAWMRLTGAARLCVHAGQGQSKGQEGKASCVIPDRGVGGILVFRDFVSPPATRNELF